MQLLSSVSVAALAALPATFAAEVACDLSKGSSTSGAQAICADFCNYKCSFFNASSDLPTETGKPQNITLYRITPFNVSGIRNKNTGDAPGDVGFFLERKNITQQCAKDPHSFGCFLDGDNMYGQYTVEVDGLYGPYEECNPVTVGGKPGSNPFSGGGSGWADTQNFQCGENCLMPTRAENCTSTGHSSWDKPHNGSSREGGFNCFCDGTQRNKKTVGREPRGGQGRPAATVNLPGKGWYQPPPQCASGFEPTCLKKSSGWGGRCEAYGGCLTGHSDAADTVKGWSFASTSALACDACESDPACKGWAITTPDNTTAVLFKGLTVVRKDIQCISAKKQTDHHGYGGGGRSWYGVDAGAGHWFNTPTAGECAPGEPLGAGGCTWRVAETVKYANASCIDGKVDAAVEQIGAACFDTCPQPLDRISDCYLVCYINTLTGDPGYNITKRAGSAIVEPWVLGFTEDDVAKGGCPRVEPLQCLGAQCPLPQ